MSIGRTEGSSREALRLLGLDVGDRRIGVAVSDPTGSIARPVETYRRLGGRQDLEKIAGLADELEASAVVVGLPKNMNGSEGEQAFKTRQFADAVQSTGLRVVLWDERLSTVEATRRLVEQRHKKRTLKDRVDSEAAAVILQTYLDHLRIKELR